MNREINRGGIPTLKPVPVAKTKKRETEGQELATPESSNNTSETRTKEGDT